jgi:hypothetical protein
MALLAGTATIRAQAHDESAIAGVVVDPTGAVVRDAAITVSSPALLGGPRSSTTDPGGAYRVALLPAGTYDVIVRLASFAVTRRSGIVLSANATSIVDVRLELGSINSEVEVRGAPSTLDVLRASSPTVIDAPMLQHLPTNRVVEDLLNLTPGISKVYAPGAPDDVAFGGTQGSNAVIVDGVSATEPETGAVRVTPNFNWLDQVQVEAIGANAEYGRTTGAILDATLRSGSNRFAGLAEYRATPAHWVASNSSSPSFTPRSIRRSWDGDAQAGGPIRADRIWFFGGLASSTLLDRPAGVTGPDYTSVTNPSGMVKADGAMGRGLLLDGMFSVDRRDEANEGLSVSYPTSSVAERDRQTNSIGSVRMRWMAGSRSSVELQFRGYSSPNQFDSQLPNGDAGPPPHYDNLTGVVSVNTTDVGTRDRRVASIGGSFTRHADSFLKGSHDVKVGFEFRQSRSEDVDRYPGGRTYFDDAGSPAQVDLWPGADLHATGNEAGLFAQDAWRLAQAFTINAGARVDWNRGSVPGGGTVFATTPVSPRIGLAWDVGSGHRTVVRAHYGLYADPLYTNLFSFMDRTDNNADIYATVVGPEQFVQISRTDAFSAAVDPHLSPPHVAQSFVGLEHQIAAAATFEVRYINRRFKDFIAATDSGSIWVPTSMRDPGPDNIPGTADDGAVLSVYRLTNPGYRTILETNPDAAYRRYDAVQIIGTKRYSRGWQLVAGYTRSRTAGTVASGGTFANAFIDRWDLSFYGPFADPNRLVNKDAPFTSSELKIEGTYHVAQLGGLNVSAIFRRVSGAPVRRVVQFRGLIAGVDAVIAEPSISMFRQAQRTLDLHVEKTFPTGVGQVGLYLDAFNVTNQGIATSVVVASGTQFGAPITWSDPRTARAGLRWMF